VKETEKRTGRSFHEDAARTLTRLRSELSEVIAALPDDVRKGADLHRALRIDRKLSWKVFKVARATDPVAVGPHVPSRGNLRSFLRAATKQGVPERLIEAASNAADEFEKMVARHAGDRSTFDSMVSALGSDETAEQLNLVHRRQAFRAQRHILGVQAETQLKFAAMQPSDAPMMLDGIRVEGFVGLRQLRGNAPLIISYSGVRSDDGSVVEIKREPLEPVSEPHGVALLRDFCSKPLPELRGVQVQAGFVNGEIRSRDVGKCAAVTCMEGHLTRRAVQRYRTECDRIGATVVTVRTPVEVAILDLLLHEDTYGRIEPSMFVHAEHAGEMLWDGLIHKRHRLPIHHSVVYLGKGPTALHTPDVPRYAEMARHVFGRAGWEAERFDVYRCRIEYPVMPSSIGVAFDLPDAPTECGTGDRE
jgi:hypothetical protein